MWAWLVGAAVAVVVHFHNQSGLYEHCIFKLTTEEPSYAKVYHNVHILALEASSCDSKLR